MRNKKVLFVVQAALIAAIYQCIQPCIRRDSGAYFRSAYRIAIFYAGSDTRIGYRLFFKQSVDRMSADGCTFWKFSNPDWSNWKLSAT